MVRYWPLALLVAAGTSAMLILAVKPAYFGLAQYPLPLAPPDGYSNIKQLGLDLFTNYLYPFEIAAVILLAAMISAITLTFRGRRPGVKAQIVSRQIQVDPKSRLKVLKMPSEEKGGGHD